MELKRKRCAASLREAAQDLGLPVGLLVDLPGPRFRLGSLPGGQRELLRGEIVTLGPVGDSDQKAHPIRNTRILASIAHGHLLHLADGTVIMRSGASIKSRVVVGGGFVLVPILHQRLGETLGWLTPREFLSCPPLCP